VSCMACNAGAISYVDPAYIFTQKSTVAELAELPPRALPDVTCRVQNLGLYIKNVGPGWRCERE
jgi:hypothetical protein